MFIFNGTFNNINAYFCRVQKHNKTKQNMEKNKPGKLEIF